jgi:hypothetical protein
MDRVHLEFSLVGTRSTAAWMLGSFLVVFLATRLITRLIRAGRGPFRNNTIGGLHVHHLVPGIFLMLLTGAAEFTYRPQGFWLAALAVGFGAGAALTLDEFALWLHLSDVYWKRQGRVSVDAVLIVAALGGLLVLGFNPGGAETTQTALELVIAGLVNLAFSLVAAGKGKIASAIVGVFFTPIAIVAASRLAKPGSPWARRRYPAGSPKDVRSRGRYPLGRQTWLDAIAHAVGGSMSQDEDPADAADSGDPTSRTS